MAAKSETIDFHTISGPVYTGRDRGERLRVELNLDAFDADADVVVEVCIPNSAYTVSSSFFLGLFGPSVIRAGSRESFYLKYRFSAPKHIQDVIGGYVTRALQTRNLFK